MNGAESLVRTLLASGVDTCFANPGTSEINFVAALDRAPGMRCVLALFEGVVTGAADGYGRMARKPAATLMHCGPGFANGLAYLHNAKRAETPILNIVGDQATYHAPFNPPLASDIEAWARPVSQWVRRVVHTQTLGVDAAEAVQGARNPPGGSATLILPSDVSWSEGGVPGAPLPVPMPAQTTADAVAEAARALRSGEPALILMSGAALLPEAFSIAYAIAAGTGAQLMTPTFNARIARGRGRPPLDIVPYPVDESVAKLKHFRHLILVGTGEPVAFFAYPGKPSIVSPPDAAVHVLARPEHDLKDALARLAEELRCPARAVPESPAEAAPTHGPLTPEAAAAIVAALMPDHAILVDEAITLRGPFFAGTRNAPPHDWLQVPGGAIGGGLPLATGAALGAPGRRVIVLQGDGSAAYTLQALWTQARENLDITTILLSNRKYAILFKELADVGAPPGQTARDLFELMRPNVDWLRVAGSMGVEAGRADTLDRFADLLRGAFARKGPFLIELML
ncbi:MAG: acetolactate synthase large subunit [Alphaproteobacteria bacterium]|nr:acetolactate synthase large subunit [Alphaproteobacteria bacterium]